MNKRILVDSENNEKWYMYSYPNGNKTIQAVKGDENKSDVGDDDGTWYAYYHPRPYLAVDGVVLGYVQSSKTEPLGSLRVLLTYREREKKWSLPGTFLRSSNPTEDGEYGDRAETIVQAFRRSLKEKLLPTLDGYTETIYLSKYYNKDVEAEGRRSSAEEEKGERFFQLPIRSKVARDENRIAPAKDEYGNEMKDENGNKIMIHPNYRVITVPLIAFIEPEKVRKQVDRYNKSQWIPLEWLIEDNEDVKEKLMSRKNQGVGALRALPRDPQVNYRYMLAFDHGEIIVEAVQFLRNVIRSVPAFRELLPERFKLSDLNRIYDEIVGYSIEPSNFRKSMMERGKPRQVKSDDGNGGNMKNGVSVDDSYKEKNLVVATTETDTDTSRRSATLVMFNEKVYEDYLKHQDFNFAL